MAPNRTKAYRVGSRRSPLALKQVEEVLHNLRGFYPEIGFDVVGIDTYGDKDRATPISEIEGMDFFTREIEAALLKGEIDFAVHSAKDLPNEIPNGLYIGAITKSIDPYDALVSKHNLHLEDLPYDAKIGASSARRKKQLKSYRSDFQIIDIRGNIEERLAKFEKSDLDALVIAACALVRLGLEDRIAERIPFEILRPHPLQGSIALETREDNEDLIKLLSNLNSYDIALNYKMS